MRSLAVAASLLALGAHAVPTCPAVLRDPYAKEESPFGWPLAPNDWDFAHSLCWEQKYLLCGGTKQSPMALDFRHEDASCQPDVSGSAGALTEKASYKVVSGNPVVQVSNYMRSVMVRGDFGTLTLKDASGADVVYQADQVHLTANSMHSVNGTHHAAEMLIVHKPAGAANELGGSVIVSVLFDAGESSDLFQQIGLTSERSSGEATWAAPQSIDLSAAVASALAGDVYSYAGSVPVPPCSEDVTYFIPTTVEHASVAQIQKLEEILRAHAGGTAKRPPVARDHASGTTCRAVHVNDVTAVGANTGESACASAVGTDKERSAACWTGSCGASPINIVTASASTEMGSMAAADMMHYKPTGHVEVTPHMYTLDASVHGGNFGYLLVNGHQFQAKKISIKPMSAHTINGQRYAGELMIEHEMFGDSMGGGHHAAGHRRLETEGDSHGDSHGESDGHGAGHGARKITVSVPLTVGSESELLRHLGLGVVNHKVAIRDGHSYSVHDEVDLESGLASSISGPWFWYQGSALHGNACSEFGMRWIVFQTPLEVSFEQLNSLVLPVSGVDSSPPTSAPTSTVYASSMPIHAAEHGDGACDSHWTYDKPSCWGTIEPLCAAGTRQSPVNIETEAASKTGTANFLSRVSWKPVSGLRLHSNGHSLHTDTKQMGYISVFGESGFPDFYQVTSLDVHMPSEHMINGKQYAGEIQVTHKKQDTVGVLEDDDLIIMSFMFDIAETNNTLLKQMHIPGHLPTANGFVEIPTPVDIMWALGPSLDGSFYRYEGSLTEPGCAETAKWFIFEQPQTMSLQQYNAFKAAYGTNNRPVQAFNGRDLVKNSFEEGVEIDYRFFLSRTEGRDRFTPPAGLIVVPIVATVLLLLAVTTSMWVREETKRKSQSAGGLESVIGRREYDRM